LGEEEGAGNVFEDASEFKSYEPPDSVYYGDFIGADLPTAPYGDAPQVIHAGEGAEQSNMLRGLNQNASHAVAPPHDGFDGFGVLRLARTTAEWMGMNQAVQAYNEKRAWNFNHK
jgi:hypothetical protein